MHVPTKTGQNWSLNTVNILNQAPENKITEASFNTFMTLWRLYISIAMNVIGIANMEKIIAHIFTGSEDFSIYAY